MVRANKLIVVVACAYDNTFMPDAKNKLFAPDMAMVEKANTIFDSFCGTGDIIGITVIA